MTRTTFDALTQTADEWLELSTRLREQPPAVIDAPGPAVRSDIVLRIRIPRKPWRSTPATSPQAGSSRRGLSDRLHSLLYQ